MTVSAPVSPWSWMLLALAFGLMATEQVVQGSLNKVKIANLQARLNALERDEIKIGSGEFPDCAVRIDREVWDELNAMGIYKLVAECEDGAAAWWSKPVPGRKHPLG